MKEKSPLLCNKKTWSPSPLAGQIILVTTLNADGQSNVPPKSWISMMAFDPALLAVPRPQREALRKSEDSGGAEGPPRTRGRPGPAKLSRSDLRFPVVNNA